MLLPIVALSVGCYFPWRHRVAHTPVIHGTLTRDSTPLATTPVCVTPEPTEARCEDRLQATATTNDAGRFVLCPIWDHQWGLLISGLGHRRFHWTVWARDDGEWQSIHSDSHYTAIAGPRFLSELDCDMARADGTCVVENQYEFDQGDLARVLGDTTCKGIHVDPDARTGQ